MGTRRLAGSAALLVLLAIPTGHPLAETFDSPPSFKAADVVPGGRTSGPDYRIYDNVRNDGVMNHYRVETTWGPLQADSTDRLVVVLGEIDGLRKMHAASEKDIVKQSLEKTAMGPVETVKGVVTDPLGTAENVATGVGNFFNNLAHVARGRASKQESSALETAIGFDAAKRQIAYQFGVDPYSANPLVQQELDALTWSAVGGALPLRVLFAAIPGAAGTTVSATSFSDSMAQLVRDRSPAELRSRNAEALRTMGVGKQTADDFLDHPDFSPSRKTAITGALAKLKGVGGRDVFVRRTGRATGEPDSFFLEQQAEMLAAYHQGVAPLDHLLLAGNQVFARRQDGIVVGVFPVDYLTWRSRSPDTVEQIDATLASDTGIKGKELWLAGDASPLFKSNVEAAGWSVHANTRDQLRLK